MLLEKPKFWDKKKDNFLSILLLPFSLLIHLNNWLKNFQIKKKFKIKTICVGNIYIGGTGKTPLSIEIFKILKSLKFRAVFVKKFYSSHIDEYKLLSKIGPVINIKSRAEALKIAEKKNYHFAILDDGLQDKTIDYDLKIVCFDKDNFLGNGKLIPAGPLREKFNQIQNYDISIFNGPSKLKSELKNKIKSIKRNMDIFETVPKLKNKDLIKKNKKYLIFSGIGNPNNFKNLLKKNNLRISKFFKFPDHYSYKKKDLEMIKNSAKNFKSEILTTEKDFLRIDKKFRGGIKSANIFMEIKNKSKLISLFQKI